MNMREETQDTQATLQTLSIPATGPGETSFNYEQLYKLGADYVRQYCGKVWTDFNVHDPGMTTLELLSYVLTDVAYQASLPIADLLLSDPQNGGLEQQFHSAAEVLVNMPLTRNDYRKLLIDIPGVNNAWIHDATQVVFADKKAKKLFASKPSGRTTEAVELAGLFNVLLDFAPGLNTQAKNQVTQEVEKALMRNRNLGEDWLSVSEVATQKFFLCGSIEIEPGADPDVVFADVLFVVKGHLAPTLVKRNLTQMFTLVHDDGRPYSSDDIFNGPRLENGFISDDSLAESNLKPELRLSDVIGLIMNIEGVARVRKLHISPNKLIELDQDAKWRVPIKAGHKAELDTNNSRIALYLDDVPLASSEEKIAELFKEKLANERRLASQIRSDDLPMPKAKARKLGSYYSFQNHFPAVYGLSDIGLPSGASDEDHNKALQFKAYLLFFDQVLANFSAQISQLASLFSSDPTVTKTYAFEPVTSFKYADKLYPGSGSDALNQLTQLMQGMDARLERRNRFLDHVIARYGEQLGDFAAILVKSFDTEATSLVRYKCEMIQRLPQIGRARGQAYNYTASAPDDRWNSDNISGLEDRLAALLGLENRRRRNLSTFELTTGVQISGSNASGFKFNIRGEDNRVLASSAKSYPDREKVETAVRETLIAATVSSNYVTRENPAGKHFYSIVVDGETLARRNAGFNSEVALAQGIDNLVVFARTHYSVEGVYLIENILLRPNPSKPLDPTMPICVGANCDDCGALDPYSYRVHVVLPAYGERFRNTEFRDYVESVIRREMPAHILPKVCWASRADMATLEVAYSAWIDLVSGADVAQPSDKIETLIAALFATKSIYPTQEIVDCDDQDNPSRFIVGRTSLGSLDAEE